MRPGATPEVASLLSEESGRWSDILPERQQLDVVGMALEVSGILAKPVAHKH